MNSYMKFFNINYINSIYFISQWNNNYVYNWVLILIFALIFWIYIFILWALSLFIDRSIFLITWYEILKNIFNKKK